MRFLGFRSGLAGAAAVGVMLALRPAPATAADLNSALEAFRAGRFEQAVSVLKELLRATPDELGLRFWLGRAYLELGDFPAAETELLSVVTRKPESSPSWLWLAQVYEAAGQLKQARAAYEKVLELDPKNAQAREALSSLYERPEPPRETLPPRAVGLRTEGFQVSLGDVRVRSDHLYDYTFTEAASDWVTETGHWAIVSRWACTPDWTWFGGMSDLAAVTWNKREFAGDLAVELYASFWHGIGPLNGYKNPSNLNITICGDGRNLESGYSFIVGGWHNEWTRILRRGKVVAQTRDAPALLPSMVDSFPSTYELHRKWWNLKIVKRGGRLQLFVDKALALQYDDPEPLESGHVAFWTFDNGVIMPRIKIYYEHEVTERTPVPYALEPTLPDETLPILRVSSATHPGVYDDFESGLGEWSGRDDEQGALLSLSDDTPDGSAHSLKLTNRNAGGTFGATIVKTRFDAAKLPHMRFDYRVPPEARLNFFVQAGGRLLELAFTAPDLLNPMAVPLGRIDGIVADDQWRHADVDLLGLLQRQRPGVDTFPVDEIFVGIASNDDYLQAGFGGNPALCTWYVDNFTLCGGGGDALTVAWENVSKVPADTYSFEVNDDPRTTPDEKPDAAGTTMQVAGLAPGVHYFHVRARGQDGRWGPATHYCVNVDKTGPQIGNLTPAPDSTASGEVIAARVIDEGAGVDWSGLRLTVNGEAFAVGAAGLSYDPEQQLLRFDPAAAGKVFQDGETVTVSIESAADRLGNVTSPGPTWSFQVSRALDKTPPPAPRVLVGHGNETTGYLCEGTFEEGLDEWANYGGGQGALVSRDSRTAASGKYSLRLTNANFGGGFGAYVRSSPFDAGKYRLVSFDYRIGNQIRADFAVHTNGQWRTIAFADVNNTQFGRPIGAVSDVQRDEEWHHAEFDLYRLLLQDKPNAPGFMVNHFVLADGTSSGWRGNPRGLSYNLDNFAIIPVVSSQGGLRLTLECADVSGVDAFNCVVDTSPETEVPAEARFTEREVTIASVPQGDAYVHVRARDGAGNWSETTHHRLILDGESPVVGPHQPADGVRAAQSEIVIPVRDQGVAGLDPRSLVLEVGGKNYQVDNPGLRYDAQTGQLRWNCEDVAPEPVVFADGQTVGVRLRAARDYAGNELPNPPEWSWVMDYSQDRTPPMIARLDSETHPALPVDTFESGLGEWQPYGGANAAIVERDTTTAASGQASVRVRNPAAGGTMGCTIRQTPFDAAKYPIVSFDYKVSAGVHVDLMALCNGAWVNIRFTDNSGDVHGLIPNVRADNQWHHAEFELLEILRRANPRANTFLVTAFILTDRGSIDNAANATLNVDNFAITRPGGGRAALSWRATDTTGIVAYSYEMNDNAATTPDEQGEGRQTTASFDGLAPGLHFFHVRAKDGAGNWGPPAHYPVLVR
jgi:hypothetical protein